MSFLSTLGKVFKGFTIGAGIAGQVAPLVPGPTGGILAGISGIGAVVGVIEGAIEKGTSGSQKLALAAPIVEQAILAELSAHGLKIADNQKFKDAVTKLTSDVVDLYNSLETTAPAPSKVADVTIVRDAAPAPIHEVPSV